MKRQLIHFIVYPLLSILIFAVAANAEPVTQEITLKPGWNAIFLEVEPPDTDPSMVFTDIDDLQSVWQWNHRAGNVTVEFIQNPDQLVAPEPRMLVYIPDGLPGATVSNLSAIQGNNAYLVQIGGTVDQYLTVTGEPVIPRHIWKSNSFNFVGFHLTDPTGPSYTDFFASSSAHDGQTIYKLDNPTGTWQEVTTENMVRGEAFWIYCNGSSTFNGPISVTLELSSGLHFGDKLFEQQLYLNNNSGEEKTFYLTLPVLTPAPESNPVHYWVFDIDDEVPSWEEFPASSQFVVSAGDSQKIRMGVKRSGLTVGPPDYVTNIEVSDHAGVSFLLPFSVTGIDYSGLWTGFATIKKVSDINKLDINSAYDPTPQPTGSEFDFRLIIHANQGGGVDLLSQVIQMWDEGDLKPDPDNLGGFIVDTSGNFVLLTDDNLIGDYTGSLLRDGQPIGRRISAPAFPRIPLEQRPLHGTAKDGGTFNPSPGNYLENSPNPVFLAAKDPTNPFVHMFHKIHGIADGEIVDDKEYEITRTVWLHFEDEDADGNPITGLPSLNWGSTEIGGIYEEIIVGLNDINHPIKIMGTFVLHRVSNVDTLTQ